MGLSEVILVVRAPSRAVCVNKRRLPASARPPAALGVVGRRRRHVAEVDDVQLGDVDAQLHRRRAKQQREVGRPESFFPLLAIFRRDLGGVLARFQSRLQINEASIAFDEVFVDLWRDLAHIEQSCQIRRSSFSIPGQPTECIRIDLIARDVSTTDFFDNPVPLERTEEEPDGSVDLGATPRLAVRHVRLHGATQVSSVAAIRGHEKSWLLSFFWARIGDIGRDEFALLVEEPHGAVLDPGLRLIDQLALLEWVQNVDFNREISSQDVEQRGDDLTPERRRAITQGGGNAYELLSPSGPERKAFLP